MSAAPELEYDLEHDMFRLLREEPFFAAVSRMVHKSPSKSIKTAGVTVTDDGNFEMLYNPVFFASLPDVLRRGIIKHEMYHLIFEHCTTRRYSDEVDHKLHNIASDLAINCHLKGEVPESGLFPDKLGFEEFLSTEQYINLVRQKYVESQGQGKGQLKIPADLGDLLDDHDGWDDADGEGEGGDEARAMAKERLREGLKRAVDEAQKSSKGFGNLHQSVRDAIMRFINGSVNWKAVLRNFIGQSQRSTRTNSIKRINRRFPYIHPGKRTLRTAHIAVAIDQSGSVGDDLLALFFAELNGLAKNVTFTVVPFDTRVDDKLVYQWKKGEKYEPKRVMRGGTCFDAPTEWVNNHPEIDGLIILTDMEAPAPKPCKRRRLWMTNEAGKQHPFFKTNEIVIEVRDMHNR